VSTLVPVAGEPRWMIKRDGWWWFVYYRKEYTSAWVYMDNALFLFKFNARRFVKRESYQELYDKYGQRTW